jgi:hypothetical protein
MHTSLISVPVDDSTIHKKGSMKNPLYPQARLKSAEAIVSSFCWMKPRMPRALAEWRRRSDGKTTTKRDPKVAILRGNMYEIWEHDDSSLDFGVSNFQIAAPGFTMFFSSKELGP